MTQTKNETPTLSEVIRVAIEDALLNINTAMPGEIQSYDSATNFASVQPVFKRKYSENEEIVKLPIINQVPVAFPRANQAAITFPIKKGDTVLLIFSQRSLDKWKQSGGIISPDDPRTQDISDAIAIPGVYPVADPIVIDGDNLVIRHLLGKVTVKQDGVEIAAGAGLITVDKTGKVTVGNGSIDLLDLIDQMLTAIQKLTVLTRVGDSSIPVNTADFGAIQQKLGLIKQ